MIFAMIRPNASRRPWPWLASADSRPSMLLRDSYGSAGWLRRSGEATGRGYAKVRLPGADHGAAGFRAVTAGVGARCVPPPMPGATVQLLSATGPATVA